ncbi:MAG TPA: iron ABC transporter permease [Mesorhizobium sp.]|jgi:iron complex transport system permease protein|nr:iron ABC transporter permease [Mesorhizobium sp.]
MTATDKVWPPFAPGLRGWVGPGRRGVPGDRAARARAALLLLSVLLALAVCVGLSAGASDVSAWEAGLGLVTGGEALSARDRLILFEIRLPRVALGVLVGAALAFSGAVMQGLFRNPLADPGIVGVSSGAALGAVAVIVLGGPLAAAMELGVVALPVAAFLGALVTTALLYRIATRAGRTSVPTLLLAGIALGALAGALTGVMVFVADDGQLRELTFWSLGSLAGATWEKVFVAGAIIMASLAAGLWLARGLDALALGEAVAGHLGRPVQMLKHVSIAAVAAATGAAVSVSGGIGFVGIVAPHLLRLLIGPSHRYLLPASALLGASLLLMADAAARVLVAPAELPIGIVTGSIGAPFFLWVLLRGRGFTVD